MASIIFNLGSGLNLESGSDIEPYLSKLKELPEVREVHFGGNTFGVGACEAIAAVLKNLTSLEVADFADIFTRRKEWEIPQAIGAICGALISHKSLLEIDLSDNAFGPRALTNPPPEGSEPSTASSRTSLLDFLSGNRDFHILKLANNGLGPQGAIMIAEALEQSAKLSKAEGRKPNLQVIVCGRNRLESGSSIAWSKAFAALGTLTEVRLYQNGIRPDGIVELMKGLAQCPNLQHLDLQDNTLTENGSAAVAKALPSWPHLRVLNLSDCLLRSRGGISLATALSAKGVGEKLEVLKLQYNEMDHKSLDVLAAAILDHLTHLTTLELNGNRADPEEDCITKIKEALEAHGHEDALDELDDMEEYDEEEAEAQADEIPSEDEKETKAKIEEKKDSNVDDLADLLGKTSLGN